jgi:hypothetical protein
MILADSFDTLTLQAFSLAVLQLDASLQIALQPQVREIRQLLRQNPKAASDQIRQFVKQHDTFNRLYESAYQSLDQGDRQERAKGIFGTNGLGLNGSGLNGTGTATLTWEEIAFPLLDTDRPRLAAKKLLKQLKSRKFQASSTTHTFVRSLENAIAAVDQQAIDILKAIERRPVTLEDLVYVVGIPFEQAHSLVQDLWKEEYISRLQGNAFLIFFPFFDPQRQQKPIDAKSYLSLTSKGYFLLHPILYFPDAGVMAR